MLHKACAGRAEILAGGDRRREPALSGIDHDVLRIARKLAPIQNVQPGEVIVPYEIAVAYRELTGARGLARRVLRGDHEAAQRLVILMGGVGPKIPAARREARPVTPRATALLGLAQTGPIEGLPCLGHIQGDLELLQAAYKLDADRHHRDGRITSRTAGFVRERRGRMERFERRLDRRPGPAPADGAERGPLPGRRTTPGRDRSPLFPPGTEAPPLPDPVEPEPDMDFCLDLADLCLQLYEDFALASLAEEDSQLIATVDRDCLCAGELDAETEFVARPDAQRPFPARRDDYRLYFRGDDITGNIRGWSRQEIRFTIPAGSSTGYVYLRRLLNTVSVRLGGTLANLCGVPNIGGPGRVPILSPRALISIVHPPVIDSFTVNRSDQSPILTEACTALRLEWAVRLEDQQRVGQLLPPCATVEVEIRDFQGNVLHTSSEPVGTWFHNPAGNTRYFLRARSLAGGTPCDQAESAEIQVQREHRLAVEAREPSLPTIVAGKAGTLTIRLSCPAPARGAEVALLSSDRSILLLPESVMVLPGERSAPVHFSTSRDHHGQVTITASLSNHREGTLVYAVEEHLTAIVLSGGGAKGSFEVGALLYLREIWNEIRPRIICGTSVGAINALALAESTDSRGVNKLEDIWLGLEFHADMYEPSPELRSALEAVEVSFEDFMDVFRAEEGASIDLGPLDLIDESGAAAWTAAGWAVGGPVGAFAAGLASVFAGAGTSLADVYAAIQNASFLLDLAPTQWKIKRNVDTGSIATSGMTLRLATVALEDGELYYVTESSRLLRGRARDAGFDEPITSADPLVLAAMASSAIPGVFQARQIVTPHTSYFHVDGGVREVLPAQAAVELGAQLLWNISATISTADPAPGREESFGDPGMFLSIVKRGVELAVLEVSTEEKHPRAGFCGERERWLIHPAFPVHDTTFIDPGLIRINMAYGYFRAFDADQLRRGDINALQYLLWYYWTDDLIRERSDCHALEIGEWMQYSRVSGIFHHDTLQQIRRHKNRIAELIVQRFETFGAEAFPRRFSNNVLGDQSALDWATTWEVHKGPHRSFLSTINLWEPQIIEYGVTLEEGGGSPPSREPEVLPQFPLPAAVRDGLRFR